MAGYLKIRVALGGLVIVPLACGTEFQACAGNECGTTTGGGSAGTDGEGGSAGPNTGGGVTTDAASSTAQGGAATTGSTAGGGEGGDPGVGGTAGAGGSPPECEGELLPGDDACVVDESYGVFVSPGGDDASGDGTREAPFATLEKAADAAAEAGKRVYACATGGDYVSALTLTEEHDGLELYGSFDCSDWSHAGELRAKVAPDAGVALSVNAIETSLELDGFTFESADASTPGGSSIAAEIHVSSGVVLRHVVLRAGAGAAGAPGVTVNFTYPEKSALDGVDGTEESGGVTTFITCPAGDQTRGGLGGVPDPSEPTGGFDGLPNHESPGGEGGTVGADCGMGGTGARGAAGPAGSDGDGAMTLGALDNGSWVPASGAEASHGLPGQGGGGGAGAANGGGGSGGAGGCGGAGGKAGGGGGASIALLLVDAEVALLDSEVTAGDAGDGGAGSSGQAGQQEFGSSGDGYADACDGGRGGLGGNGGNAGGGAGGISVGVLVQGMAPTLTNTPVMVGTEGLAGEGAGEGNDGVPGLAQPELDLAEI